MALPSSKQQQQMSEATTMPLPMAVEGQLQWVKRALSSLSALSAQEDTAEPPSVWWPSLLFNDNDTFQEFFPEEFEVSNKTNGGESDTGKLIMQRQFENMRLQRTVMVARLLAHPITKYVELVQDPENGEDVEAHQATEWALFTRLPQEIVFSQMDPEAFAFTVVSDKTGNKIIDDKLYMKYMLALDLAYTKRIGGPNAPHDTVGSDFRDMGSKKLKKLASDVKMLSEISVEQCQIQWCKESEEEEDSEEVSEASSTEKTDVTVEASDQDKVEDSSASNGADTPTIANKNDQAETNDSAVSGSIEKEVNAKKSKATPSKARFETPMRRSLRSREILPIPPSPMKGEKPMTSAASSTSAPVDPPKKSSKRGRKKNVAPIPKRRGPARKSKIIPEDTSPKTPEQNSFASPDATAPLLTAPLLMTPSPEKDRNAVVSDSSSPASTIDTSSSSSSSEPIFPDVRSDDSFEKKCEKLTALGYTIDIGQNLYLCPNVGYKDVEKNPRWNGKKFFRKKESFENHIYRKFLRENKATPPRKTPTQTKSRKRSITVTPSSTRPKRNRRMSDVPKADKFNFKSEEEKEFYRFKPLIKKLEDNLGWQYLKANKLKNYQYVLPGKKPINEGGKYLEDFYHEEDEVIKYCMNLDYFKKRKELGLE